MSYGHLGPGVLQPIGDWCSSTHPQEGCNALNNICKPMDFASLESFKGLQRQLNRLLKADGHTLLDVDGRIGPKTVSAVGRYSSGGYTHCDQVAAGIDALRSTISGMANARGAAPVADPPRSAERASKVDPTTGEMVHPDVYGAGFLGMPWWLLLAAGAAGYLVYTTTGPAKKKRRKAPAKKRKTTRRRRRTPKTRTTITRYR